VSSRVGESKHDLRVAQASRSNRTRIIECSVLFIVRKVELDTRSPMPLHTLERTARIAYPAAVQATLFKFPWTLKIEQAAPMWRTFAVAKLRFVDCSGFHLELHCHGTGTVDELVSLPSQGLILEYPFVIPVSLLDSAILRSRGLFR
jgi:hypothetical protein